LDKIEDDAQLNSRENIEQSNDIVDGGNVAANFDANDEGEPNIETIFPPQN
jgi:hypothetical protein